MGPIAPQSRSGLLLVFRSFHSFPLYILNIDIIIVQAVASNNSESKIGEVDIRFNEESKVDKAFPLLSRATHGRRRATSSDVTGADATDAAMLAAQRLLARLDPSSAAKNEPADARVVTVSPQLSGTGRFHPAASSGDDHVAATSTHHAGFRRMRSGSGSTWSDSAIRTAAGLAAMLDPPSSNTSHVGSVESESKAVADAEDFSSVPCGGESKVSERSQAARGKSQAAGATISIAGPGAAYSSASFRM